MRIRLTFDIPENTEGQQAQPEAPETSATVVQTETGYAVWLRPADNYVTGAGPMRQAHCKSTLPEALIDIAEHFGATYDPDFDVQFGDDATDDATDDPFDGPAHVAAKLAIKHLNQLALTLQSHRIPVNAQEMAKDVDDTVRALRHHILKERPNA